MRGVKEEWRQSMEPCISVWTQKQSHQQPEEVEIVK